MCEEQLGIVVGNFQGLGGAGYDNVHCECDDRVPVSTDGKSDAEQEYSLLKAKSRSSVVTKWMGDVLLLGFAPALRSLQGQILQNTESLLSMNNIEICLTSTTA